MKRCRIIAAVVCLICMFSIHANAQGPCDAVLQDGTIHIPGFALDGKHYRLDLAPPFTLADYGAGAETCGESPASAEWSSEAVYQDGTLHIPCFFLDGSHYRLELGSPFSPADYGDSTESCGGFTNSLGMTFRLVPAGTFTMGSPTDEPGRTSEEENQRQVTISESYYIQTTEVTQAQWEAVMGVNPSYFANCGDDCPVERISWDDIQDFLSELNKLRRREGTYALPTEAQWEYAARSGGETAFANGGITETGSGYDANLDAMGWYRYNSNGTTHPVARKDPNAWGLYDMHGNVWEFVRDLHAAYPTDPGIDPTGASSGSSRVYRGGAWGSDAAECRSAFRSWHMPDVKYYVLGFRLAFYPAQ